MMPAIFAVIMFIMSQIVFCDGAFAVGETRGRQEVIISYATMANAGNRPQAVNNAVGKVAGDNSETTAYNDPQAAAPTRAIRRPSYVPKSAAHHYYNKQQDVTLPSDLDDVNSKFLLAP